MFGSCSCMITAIKPQRPAHLQKALWWHGWARLGDWTLPGLVFLRDHWLFEPKDVPRHARSAGVQLNAGSIDRQHVWTAWQNSSVVSMEIFVSGHVLYPFQWTAMEDSETISCRKQNNCNSLCFKNAAGFKHFTTISGVSPLLWNCVLRCPFAKTW